MVAATNPGPAVWGIAASLVCVAVVLAAPLGFWGLLLAHRQPLCVRVGVCCTPVLQPCLRNGAVEPWQSMGVVKAAMRGAPYDRLVAAATVRVSDVWRLCKLLFSCVPQQPQHDRGADLNGPA